MKSNVYGEFYDAVILQIVKPVIADVSAADYTAQKLNKNTAAIDATGEQKPFILNHPVALKLKVQTWKGEDVTYIFHAWENPTPLKKIYKTPIPLVVDADGNATATQVTSIQIGY